MCLENPQNETSVLSRHSWTIRWVPR